MVIIDDAYIENYLKKFNRELNEDLQNEIRWYEAANHIAQELIPHFHNLEMIVKDIRQYLDVVVKAEKDLLPPMQRIREELERESFTSREASAVFGGFYHKLKGRNLKDKATAAETQGMYNVINKKIQAAKKTIIHFQIPFHNAKSAALQNKFKARFCKCVSNSFFTKSFVDKT